MAANVTEIKLQANMIEGTDDLNDTDAMESAKCSVIALMELARDGDVGPFKDKWHHFNLNRGVALESTDVKFREQETALAKLYEDEKQARALAKLYEDEELARALANLHKDEKQAGPPAKLDEDEKQTRPPANLMMNVKHKEKLAITWIKDEVRKIVQDVEDGGWRKKTNESQNGGEELEDETGCNVLCGVGRKGSKDRGVGQKGKEGVGKEGRHLLKVIRNALPAIYPGRTALHMAAANGNARIVRVICAVDGVDLNKRDVFGYTPLHLACYSTHAKRDEVIKILLATEQTDANVTAKGDGYYMTPLHMAVKTKSTDIVDMLLDWPPKGRNHNKVLDVDTKSNAGWTALHLAIKLKIIETDDKKKADFVRMIKAIIRFMNKHSPESINKSDNKKSTPLHTSVEARDHELVEMLLEEGDKIDPQLLDSKRRTALEIAVDKRDYEMVEMVQSYLERAGIVGNHQAYADSANTILIGAALLVTVTFAAWVQVPTNDSTAFWVFISLSFYFAVATFISAAGAAIPSKGSTLGLVRRAVLLSAFCLAISLACAVAAFAIAGFIIVPHGIEHQRKVIATTVIGGFVCLFCLLSFVRKILKALGLFFLMLDLFAQQQLEKYIYKPVVDGVKFILGKSLVHALEKQYKKWYTTPVRKFFNIEDEDDPTSHDGSASKTTEASTFAPGNEKSGDEASTSSPGNEKSGDETGNSLV